MLPPLFLLNLKLGINKEEGGILGVAMYF